MSDVSDAMLLARFHGGDVDALDRLFARYETPLFHFLVGMLKDHHRAEDALQETFVRALSRLDGVDPEHLRGWLFTVAYHQAMLARRRDRSRPADSLPEPDMVRDREQGPVEQAEQADEARRLRRLIGQLPAAQQEVIRQRVYEGKRFREIAADLNCPLNTALARMHEGLKRLRLLWETDHAREPDDGLAALALLYANSEMDVDDARAFEQRLGENQAAREALTHAVALAQTLGELPASRPDPCYRQRVRHRLMAARRTRFPGHPVVWSLLGAAAAVLILLPLLHGRAVTPGVQTSASPLATSAEPQPNAVVHVSATTQAEVARAWAELDRNQRIAKAYGEEQRRKSRIEERRTVRPEDRADRYVDQPMTMKQ